MHNQLKSTVLLQFLLFCFFFTVMFALARTKYFRISDVITLAVKLFVSRTSLNLSCYFRTSL